MNPLGIHALLFLLFPVHLDKTVVWTFEIRYFLETHDGFGPKWRFEQVVTFFKFNFSTCMFLLAPSCSRH